ncbi:SIR2 family protein [Merdimonas faecis]|uniref:SIR2 family protein n=1 Tax=Merdimonas faecis TaxID=1653435 RepID=UPI0022E77D97|nr:SIR2 family protein [Merdimonas faecis]
MNITVEDFINDFSYKLINNQVSFFIGAGVSTELDLPNWKNLFQDIADKLHINIDNINDYYQLAQYYCNQYSESDLKRIISPKLRTQEFESPTLKRLLKLGFKSIWTTNFDTAIENCLFNEHINFVKIHNDNDLSCVNLNDSPIIYKINGDINDLENIILTQRDWEKFEYTHPTMLTFLKKELVSNTFLFLGYSFHDNLIKSTLSGIRQFVGSTGIHHYAFFEKKATKEFNYFIDDLDKNYNVKAVLIDSYSEIPDILDRIFYKSIERNIFISGRLDDFNDKIELYANNLLKNLSVSLLKNNYNLCTGMGRKIGYFVAGPAIQYLLYKGIKDIDHHIKIRPFDDNQTPADFSQYRKYLIEQNNIMIFVFGQKFVNGISENSRGVIEEFEIATEMGKKVIPIGGTGFAAREIWNRVNSRILKYPYLEAYRDILESETDIDIVSRTVVEIINSIVNTY